MEDQRNSNGGIVAIVVLLLVIAGVLIYTHFGPMAPTKWEYKLADVPDATFDDTMNNLGSQGWELVFARRANGGQPDDNPASAPVDMEYEVIFKRPIAQH